MTERNYKVVALIGSMRFQEEHDNIVKQLFLDGHVPIPLISIQKTEDSERFSGKLKNIADDHIRKVIDISDCVYVINTDGYIGSSTLGEIDYAIQSGKKIICRDTPLTLDTWQLYVTRTTPSANGQSQRIKISNTILRERSSDEAKLKYMFMHNINPEDLNGKYKIECYRPIKEMTELLKQLDGPCYYIGSYLSSLNDKDLPSKNGSTVEDNIKQLSATEYMELIRTTIPNIIVQNSNSEASIHNKLAAIQDILSI